MLRSWKFWTVMAFIAGLTGLFAYGFTQNPREVKSPLVGKPAPGFELTEMNSGALLRSADLKGTPYLINFWASWCTACREEAPYLEAAYERLTLAHHPDFFAGRPQAERQEAERQSAAVNEGYRTLSSEPARAAYLLRLLAGLDAKVARASDGEAALAALRADPERFDVVIRDRFMPRMEGMQCRAQMKAEPALAAIAQEGWPELGKGGNVLLPALALRLSLRIPPTLEPKAAGAAVKAALEADPPFGARVSVSVAGEPGWNAPPLEDWLAQATDAASREFYGKEACYYGIGGSIPFMHMIGERFPAAQFLITGVLGPNANAHGPNEFLHVPYVQKLTCCLVRVLAAHHERYARKKR